MIELAKPVWVSGAVRCYEWAPHVEELSELEVNLHYFGNCVLGDEDWTLVEMVDFAPRPRANCHAGKLFAGSGCLPELTAYVGSMMCHPEPYPVRIYLPPRQNVLFYVHNFERRFRGHTIEIPNLLAYARTVAQPEWAAMPYRRPRLESEDV